VRKETKATNELVGSKGQAPEEKKRRIEIRTNT